MKAFKWKDGFSVGIAEIDADHRRLIEHLNDLFVACYAGQGPTVVEGILDRFIADMREHCKREEDILESTGYSELLSHRADHIKAVLELDDIREEYASGDAHILSNETLKYMDKWLKQHIICDDKEFAEFVSSRS